jgi:protein tyrosine/serine phosphatase
MNDPDKPIPESYWVVPGQFLAGEYPSDRDETRSRARLAAFLNAGFDTFIDLTNEGERPPYRALLEEEAGDGQRTIDYQRFPFPDFNVPEPATMLAVLDALEAALAAGRKVYLHCVGGIGRTGTTVGCYLVRHGRSGSQALAELARLYAAAAQSSFSPRSPEDSRQVAFVRDWQG